MHNINNKDFFSQIGLYNLTLEGVFYLSLSVIPVSGFHPFKSNNNKKSPIYLITNGKKNKCNFKAPKTPSHSKQRISMQMQVYLSNLTNQPALHCPKLL